MTNEKSLTEEEFETVKEGFASVNQQENTESLEDKIKAQLEEEVKKEEEYLEKRKQMLRSLVIQQDYEEHKEEEVNKRDVVYKPNLTKSSTRSGMTMAGSVNKGSHTTVNHQPNKRRGEFIINPDKPTNNIDKATMNTGGKMK